MMKFPMLHRIKQYGSTVHLKSSPKTLPLKIILRTLNVISMKTTDINIKTIQAVGYKTFSTLNKLEFFPHSLPAVTTSWR